MAGEIGQLYRSSDIRLTLTDAVFHSVVLLRELVAVVQDELSVEDVDNATDRQVAVVIEVRLSVAHLCTKKRRMVTLLLFAIVTEQWSLYRMYNYKPAKT